MSPPNAPCTRLLGTQVRAQQSPPSNWHCGTFRSASQRPLPTREVPPAGMTSRHAPPVQHRSHCALTARLCRLPDLITGGVKAFQAARCCAGHALSVQASSDDTACSPRCSCDTAASYSTASVVATGAAFTPDHRHGNASTCSDVGMHDRVVGAARRWHGQLARGLQAFEAEPAASQHALVSASMSAFMLCSASCAKCNICAEQRLQCRAGSRAHKLIPPIIL